MITVLCGGVGAARFLAGLLQVVPPGDITAIVNTGDDLRLHGLHIAPDLDTVTYTLAGAIDPERGWGLSGETWQAMAALRRYEAERPEGSSAGVTWFGLGDQDLATHLYRTHRLAEGAPLSTVTAEVTAAWGLRLAVVPVTDDPLATLVTVVDEAPTGPGTERPGIERPGIEREVSFQEYFVQRHHSVPVTAVRFAGAAEARPAPGVLEAIASADAVVVAPSNPIVSIGPLLAVPGVREAVEARRDRTVAVSPIVAGAALKGPADRMLVELGHEASVVGVARLYRDLAATLVIDTADEARAGEVAAEGMGCVVTDTIMRTPEVAAALARTVLAAAAPGAVGGAQDRQGGT